MSKVPSLPFDRIIRALQKDGWMVVRQRGTWNIVLGFLAVVAQAPLASLGGLVGFWYVLCGLHRFDTYRHHARTLFNPPPADDVKRLDALVRAAQKASGRDRPDLLCFTDGRGGAGRHRDRGA